MENSNIIYPVIIMFSLTISMITWLGLARFSAVRNRQVSVKFYRSFSEGEQSEKLHILSRHVQNHFEVPPLFYIGVLFLLSTDSVSSASIIAAWIFVTLRLLHTYIHIGSNNLTYRFMCFATSLIPLAVIWISAISAIIKSA